MGTPFPAPGTLLLGKYRVDREIGSGGMGIVLEATHVALDQRVAIKLLNAELASSDELVARFLREARVAAQLPSDHIARVSDVGVTEAGAPYLVMELLVGHDLEAELERRGALPVAEAVDLVLQACEGVADAHAVGLVHRDLKPANLFLTRRPNRPPLVKVLDFGLTKDVRGGAPSLTGDDSVFGTPQYMSPEQIQSAKKVDPRSDQHALAMILFELLTGRPPYVAQNVTQLVVSIATQPAPPARGLRPEVPRALDEAIGRALAKLPAGRFPDLAAFAAAIAPFGGQAAAQMAQNVQQSLAASPHAAPPAAAAPAQSHAPSDALTTVPFIAAERPLEHSQTGLTSSVKLLQRARRRQRMTAVGIATGMCAATILVGVLLLRGAPGDAPPANGGAPTAEPAPPAPPSVEVRPSPEAPPPPAPPPVATASASAGAGTSARVKPPAAPTQATPPPVSTMIEVWKYGPNKK